MSKTTPTFQKAWNEEFVYQGFDPVWIRAFCFVISCFLLFQVISTCFECDPPTDGAGGGVLWVIAAKIPNVIAIIVLALVFASSMITSKLRGRFIHNYDSICGLAIVSASAHSVCSSLLLEIRRSRFQSPYINTTIWQIDYSGTIPHRTCQDSNAVMSWTLTSTSGQSLTCNNLLLGGDIVGYMMVATALPRIFRMKAVSAIVISFLHLTLLVVSFLLIGTEPAEFIPTVLLILISGIITAYFCHLGVRDAKEKFAVEKGLKFAAEHSSNLLYTLIPRTVLTRRHSVDLGMVCGEIQHITIMFFTLERHEELMMHFSEEEFRLLDALFSDFDQAVERRGMFKYQHVGNALLFRHLQPISREFMPRVVVAADWYIVACPCAAQLSTSSTDSPHVPYPPDHYLNALGLANELRSAATRHCFHGEALRLRAGVHCGAVAGAVVGSMRSFYCLYGDTVNTAARMCKLANGEILASPDFVSAVCAVVPPGIVRFAPQGAREVKGKGMMETYEVHVLRPDALAAPVAELRKSSCGSETPASKVRTFSAGELQVEGEFPANSSESRHPLRRMWRVLRDPLMEERFVAAHNWDWRVHLAAGLVIHLIAVVLQWIQSVRPEYLYDFGTLGAPQLEEDWKAMALALNLHAAVSGATSLALLLAVLMSSHFDCLLAEPWACGLYVIVT